MVDPLKVEKTIRSVIRKKEGMVETLTLKVSTIH